MDSTISILACGIFRPELERILPQLAEESGDPDLTLRFVEAALHVDDKRLKGGIEAEAEAMAQNECAPTALLYGRMCHPEMCQLAAKMDASLPKEANCIELLLDPRRKKELDESGEIFYMTGGWLASWQEIFRQGNRWDEVDARINFGRYDRILVLDAGCVEIDEETLFAFFDYTQTPVEVEPIDLTYFKDAVRNLIRARSLPEESDRKPR